MYLYLINDHVMAKTNYLEIKSHLVGPYATEMYKSVKKLGVYARINFHLARRKYSVQKNSQVSVKLSNYTYYTL